MRRSFFWPLAAICAVVAAAVWFSVAGPWTTVSAVVKRTTVRSSYKHHRRTHAPQTVSILTGRAEALLGDIVLVALAVGAGGLSASTALLATRTYYRRRRNLIRYWLLPYRSDEARQEAVCALLEAWHQVLLERWWRRPIYGQAGITLEVVAIDDGNGRLEGRMLLGIPAPLAGAFEGALLGCYPDCRLTPLDKPFPQLTSVVRLKKRHPFIRAVRTTDITQKRNVVDALLSQMERLGKQSCVQLALVPAPALFDRWARRRHRQHERSAVTATAFDGPVPTRSELVQRELEGGLALAHRTLFFTDIRIGAASFDHCYAIAGTLRGETGGENRLVIRQMRVRSWLYRARLLHGLGNPIPGWRRGVLSSP